MSISPPSGLVLTVAKWLWGKLTQRLLMSTYMHSHEKWALRHRLGVNHSQNGSVSVLRPSVEIQLKAACHACLKNRLNVGCLMRWSLPPSQYYAEDR
ncbi:hypothetical protein ACSVHP_22905, partial [Enterobacter sp. 186315]